VKVDKSVIVEKTLAEDAIVSRRTMAGNNSEDKDCWIEFRAAAKNPSGYFR
jgi:hypothetical protein